MKDIFWKLKTIPGIKDDLKGKAPCIHGLEDSSSLRWNITQSNLNVECSPYWNSNSGIPWQSSGQDCIPSTAGGTGLISGQGNKVPLAEWQTNKFPTVFCFAESWSSDSYGIARSPQKPKQFWKRNTKLGDSDVSISKLIAELEKSK